MRDLRQDLEICNKATQGPWRETQSEGDCSGWNCPRNMEVCDEDCPMCEEYELYKGAWLDGPDYIEIGDYSYFTDKDAEFIAQAREGWPYAIERAIKAEAEVERLRLMVKSITEGLDEAIETIHYLKAENTKLRKVVEQIPVVINALLSHMPQAVGFSNIGTCLGCGTLTESGSQVYCKRCAWKMGKELKALAELDKEGER